MGTKKTYSAPKLVVHGDVQTLTQGNSVGDYTDATFPVNTPTKDITFDIS